MKRAGYYRIAIILMIGALLILHHESTKPEFEIQSTIKNTFDNYETVDISVIVRVRNYETEELMEKVRDYYSNLSGMPDELCIKLYNSKKEFTTGTVFSQKLFIKESD